MTNPLNHACLNGRRCTPGDQPATTETPNTLCPRCTARARRHIEQLPTQHLQLHGMLGEHTPALNARHAQPASTVLLNTAIDSLLEAIQHHAVMAAEIVTDALHADTPYRHHPTLHVYVCCRLIAPNLDKLLDVDGIDINEWNREGTHRTVTTTTGVAIVQELEHLSALAHYTLGLTRIRSYRDVPCSRCGQPCVGRWTGADTFDCESCGARFAETDLRRHDKILLERHRRGLLNAG